MSHSSKLTRRRFLGTAAAAIAAPWVVPSSAIGAGGRPAPSHRVTVGCIGVGGEGGRNLGCFLGQSDAQVVAVCEVDPQRLAIAKKRVEDRYGAAQACMATQDFRQILDRPDIDAVMISTPDHWHVPISVMAIRAGKDVQCEKPTLTIREGRVLADTVERYGAVYQTSTEDRAMGVHHRMAELVRNGRIGKLERIRVTLPAGPGSAGDPKPQPVPPGFDWDMWLGPAPWAPYCPGRTHWNFRWITDYSGGQLTDWGAHLIDTAQWGNDTEHSDPVEVEGTGWRHTDGLYDTYYEYHLKYRYASGVELLIDSGGVAIKFEGTEGWVGNNGWGAPVQASSPEILNTVIGPREIHLFTCPAGEHRNFLDCVKSRQDPYFPAEIEQRCCTVMHIGNIAMWMGRKLRWDPATEHFVDDADADRHLARVSRAPWAV